MLTISENSGGTITINYPLTVSSNFYLSQNYSSFTTTQIGYNTSNIVSSPVINNGAFQNLVSITTPAGGVWLVEGQWTATSLATSVESYILSLTSTSITADFTRYLINYTGNYSSLFASHITSVFITTAPTIIYLIGRLTTGSIATNSSTLIITKIG